MNMTPGAWGTIAIFGIVTVYVGVFYALFRFGAGKMFDEVRKRKDLTESQKDQLIFSVLYPPRFTRRASFNLRDEKKKSQSPEDH